MTMCACFNCRNGLVIVADQQQTFTDSHTFPECKVDAVRWKNGRAVWGYSGNYDASKSVQEELSKSFRPTETIRLEEVKEVLGKALERALKKWKKSPFYLLFGAWTENENKVVLVFNGKDVAYGDRCEVIGSESSLSRFLRDVYLHMIPAPNVWQAMVFAIYMLHQEKTYNGQYVGGGTDGMVILDSPANLVRVLSPNRCHDWEMHVAAMQSEVISYLLFLSGGYGEPPELTAQRRERINSKMEEFATEVLKLK